MDYYALDLSLPELERTFSVLPQGVYQYVSCYGLLGTYDDGLSWLKQPIEPTRPLCLLTMGSSLGNFGRDEAAKFLRDFAEIMGPGDMMLVGLDACQDEAKVFHAYNDREGKTHEFIRNGLTSVNRIVGKQAFNSANWEVVGKYNTIKQCHQAFYQAKRDILIEGISFKAGDGIRVEESYKYSPSQRRGLWERAGLAPRATFSNGNDDYRKSNVCFLLSRYFAPLRCEFYCSSRVSRNVRMGSFCWHAIAHLSYLEALWFFPGAL